LEYKSEKVATMFRLFKEKNKVPPFPKNSGYDDDSNDRILFTMPMEEEIHDATWLIWPHNNRTSRRNGIKKELDTIQRYEPSWTMMTKALHKGEKVHIIVYDEQEKERVQQLLLFQGCNMNQILFFVHPTDDVWIRDNGPIFVRDNEHKLHITDWGFNGWGKKFDYELSNQVPTLVAHDLDIPITTIPMINEGGSIEVDGNGTLMAKKSSILNRNRNPGWNQSDVELYFRRYLGVSNFIWLDGTPGLDVTDDHIDGTARFANGNTIVTLHRYDFENPKEYDQLKNATNAVGKSYKIVHLPLTKRKVVNNDYGFYVNFYVGNDVVLMPAFDDPNDEKAKNILQGIYPSREVVMVPMKEGLKDGGAVHCVTQQQPLGR
jgi:agmatine deiminase